ncbi:MAG: DUF4406 domain-containing protein [Scandinavium sp.]|uniref:DUF4406 domain-containing protein n=1 Tax=Scandinavium sp. TaxID=2830653 RepID=UPI003F3FCB3E
MKVFVDGKVSEVTSEDILAFVKVQKKLKSQGHIVFSPLLLPDDFDLGEKMDICFAFLRASDAIAVETGNYHDKTQVFIDYLTQYNLAATVCGNVNDIK